MSLSYPVFLIYSKEDKRWLAHAVYLPGCAADGATQESALRNVKKAIQEWVKTSKKLGRVIPPLCC